jgi:hypothetical protein
VQERQDALEMDVIKEMLLDSPHPAVSSIAAQALASLGPDEPFRPIMNGRTFTPKGIVISLWARIDEIFTQSFVRTGITAGKEYELLEPISTIERLARALAYYPSRLPPATSERLAAFISREPGDIRLAAIRVFRSRRISTTGRRQRGFVAASVTLTRRFLESQDIEISRLHPWQRWQLSYAAAITSDMECYSPSDQDAFLHDLLESLDLDKPPLLQQELLISLISPETIIEHKVKSSEGFPRTGSVCSPYLCARN